MLQEGIARVTNTEEAWDNEADGRADTATVMDGGEKGKRTGITFGRGV